MDGHSTRLLDVVPVADALNNSAAVTRRGRSRSIGTGGGGAAGALQLGVAKSCPGIPEAPLHLLQLGRLDKHFISFGGP